MDRRTRMLGVVLPIVAALLSAPAALAQTTAPTPPQAPQPMPQNDAEPPVEEWTIGRTPATPPPPAPPVDVPPTAVGASAGPAGCDRQRHPGLSYDPVVVGFDSADLGTGRRACPHSELRIGARGGAVVATSQFYGAIAADALISGSYSFSGKGEIFATLEAVHFQWVQNATLQGSATQLGQLTAGGSLVAIAYRDVTVSPYLRLMLPTASTPHVRTVGGEVGGAVDWRPLDVLSVHGYLGIDLSAGISAAPAQVRTGVALSAGVAYGPATWFALVVDLQTHFNSVAPLDVLAPALALRFRPYRGFSVDLSAAAPLAGADRRLALALLSLGYRF